MCPSASPSLRARLSSRGTCVRSKTVSRGSLLVRLRPGAGCTSSRLPHWWAEIVPLLLIYWFDGHSNITYRCEVWHLIVLLAVLDEDGTNVRACSDHLKYYKSISYIRTNNILVSSIENLQSLRSIRLRWFLWRWNRVCSCWNDGWKRMIPGSPIHLLIDPFVRRSRFRRWIGSDWRPVRSPSRIVRAY